MNQLFLDTLYPARCITCGKRIQSRSIALCRVCASGLSEVPFDLLDTAIELSDSVGGTVGNSVFTHSMSALWYYDRDSPARSLQQRLKYQGHRRLARRLGHQLGHVLEARHSKASFPRDRYDCIVPVPLHRVRLLERGYNQAFGIAVGVSDILQIPVSENILTRRNLAHSQVRTDRDQRQVNLEQAFEVTGTNSCRGKNILLIDDVITTGATLRNALHTLFRAGARSAGAGVLFIVALEKE